MAGSDDRSAHLAHLFLRGMDHMYLVNSVCGEPWLNVNFLLFHYFKPKKLQLYLYNLNIANPSVMSKMDSSEFKCMFELVTYELKRLPAESTNLTSYLLKNQFAAHDKQDSDEEVFETEEPPKLSFSSSIAQSNCEDKSFFMPLRPLGRGSWSSASKHQMPVTTVTRPLHAFTNENNKHSRNKNNRRNWHHRFGDVVAPITAQKENQHDQVATVKPEDDEDDDYEEIQPFNPNIELQKEVNKLAELCMEPLPTSSSSLRLVPSEITETPSDPAIQVT